MRARWRHLLLPRRRPSEHPRERGVSAGHTEPRQTSSLGAAVRRFGILFAVLTGGTAVVALALGLALGSGVGRSLSLGWYIVGSTLLVGGFFVGNRGPSRPQGEGWSP